tara:strand:- start:727 stop:2049 length:1323 start_codon:yes stop_codon:yes gene_type:complete
MTHTLYQHWDPLKVCALGKSYPPEFYNIVKNNKVRSVLERIAIETEEDFTKIKEKLEEFGVEVLRTDVSDNPDDHNIRILDDSNGQPAAPPMYPRDFTAMVGDTFYMPSEQYGDNINISNIFQRMMRDDILRIDNKREKILAKYIEDIMRPGRPISPTTALMKQKSKIKGQDSYKTFGYANGWVMGLDTDEIKKLIYAAETQTIGHTNKFPNNKKFYQFKSIRDWLEKNNVPIIYDQYINTANMIRLGHDLYFNHVNVLNKLNEVRFKEKYKKLFPDFNVHTLDIPGHSDGALFVVKPGLCIALKSEDNYKDTFPDWEIVSIKGEGWDKVDGFLKMKEKNKGRWFVKGEEDNDDLVNFVDKWMSHWVTYVEETVFDLNMLVINENNVICNGYNKKVFDAFERHNVTPHIINFRHRYFWDGGLHCISSDISRSGEKQHYFS